MSAEVGYPILMTKSEVLKTIHDVGIIPVLRAPSVETALACG